MREPGSVMGRSRVGAECVWKACSEGRSQIRLGTELWQAQLLTVNCGWLSKCHEPTGHQWSCSRVTADAVLLVAAYLALGRWDGPCLFGIIIRDSNIICF